MLTPIASAHRRTACLRRLKRARDFHARDAPASCAELDREYTIIESLVAGECRRFFTDPKSLRRIPPIFIDAFGGQGIEEGGYAAVRLIDVGGNW